MRSIGAGAGFVGRGLGIPGSPGINVVACGIVALGV